MTNFKNNRFLVFFFELFFLKANLFILPIFYFLINFYFFFFEIPYFNFPEIVLIFFLITLLLYGQTLKMFQLETNVRLVVCINIIFLFLICGGFIYLSGFNANYTFYSYIGSSWFSDCIRLFVIFLFLINIWFSFSYAKIMSNATFEFYILLAILCAFTLSCIIVRNLFLLLIFVETITFLLLGLLGFSRTKTSYEVTVKFFILSGLFTLLGVFGCLLIYSVTQTLDYRALNLISIACHKNWPVLLTYYEIFIFNLGLFLIIISLTFKLGAFPFHVYVADFASESLYPLLFFFLVPLKIVIFFKLSIFMLIFVHARDQLLIFFLFIGISSILIGAKSAFTELEIKKFLAFTSINQFGFPLVTLGVFSNHALAAAYIFLFAYSLSMILFFYIPMQVFNKNNKETFLYLNHFSIIECSARHFEPLSNNFKLNFGHQFRTAVLFFSFIGMPPLPGFGVKFLILFVLMVEHQFIIVFFILLVSLISAYYYLNIIYKIFNKNTDFIKVAEKNSFRFYNNFWQQYFHFYVFIFFILVSFIVLDISLFINLANIFYFIL